MPYVCRDCRASLPRWQGQCPTCKGWHIIHQPDQSETIPAPNGHTLKKISKINVRSLPIYTTHIPALDAALGGGLPRGTTTLFTGDPGIGKSTLLLQAISNLAESEMCAYISAEETDQQIARRARRIGLAKSRAHIFQTDDVDGIIDALQSEKVSICIVDSIQAIESMQIDYPKGSIAQIRECTLQLVNASQRLNVTTIIVCHVAGDGTLAGPRTIEHLADAILYLERDAENSIDSPGEKFVNIYAEKNRNGPILQRHRMRMTEKGLISV